MKVTFQLKMTDYKLMYFDGRGLGELIRYIFIVADVPFEDFRWKESDWPIFRPQMPLGYCTFTEVFAELIL
jgi:glutathione S-transferase